MSSQRNNLPVRAQTDEYVTNWSALLGVAGVFGALLIAAAALWWAENVQEAQKATARRQAAERKVVQLVPREHVAKQIQLRFDEDTSRPPVLLIDDIRPRDGAAVVLQRATTAAAADIAERIVARRPWNASLLWSAVEQQLTSPHVPPGYLSPREKRIAGAHVTANSSKEEHTEPLLHYLVDNVRELDLDDVANTTKTLFQAGASSGGGPTHDLHAGLLRGFAESRQDLRGLPLLDAAACQTEASIAKQRAVVSSRLRRNLLLGDERVLSFDKLQKRLAAVRSRTDADYGQNGSDAAAMTPTREEVLAFVEGAVDTSDAPLKKPDQVAILEQMLQCESPFHREFLVHLLGKIDDPQASRALARRAVYDLDDDIRSAASRALRTRPRQEYAEILERGREYPWALVARQANEAVTCLNRPVSEPPSPPATETANDPFDDATAETIKSNFEVDRLLAGCANVSPPHFDHNESTWMVREMVKVNHLRNCLMCHPASTSVSDPLRGQIPTPGEPLPQVYYSSNKGNFVRADVVYLRQDFSMMLPVKDHGRWPEMQRYDFFVRNRPATVAEMADSRVREIQIRADTRKRMIDAIRSAGTDLLDEAVSLLEYTMQRS